MRKERLLCGKAPPGWKCTRDAGHPGPCAAEEAPVVTAEGIEVPVWWSTGGGSMIRRDALETDHPHSTYQYLKRHGYTPEDYGYRLQSWEDRYPEIFQMTRGELEAALAMAYENIEAMERAGF